MARATYIYVPYDGDVPLGFFTVKHEMMAYLRRYFPTLRVEIRRYRDGCGSKFSVLEEDHRDGQRSQSTPG
jgi:hypothetical protein